MLRWLLLLLLLCNALLFLWYAQKQQVATGGTADADLHVNQLRFLHELSAGESVRPLQGDCYQLGVFASDREAEQAVSRLSKVVFDARQLPAPPEVVGYELAIEIPSDAQAQRELLDTLALAGWVPQTRQGQFILGPFTGEQAQADATLEQEALREGLGLASEVRSIRQPATGVLLEVEVPAGTEIGPALRQLLLRGWPGLKIEKKLCSGLAQPQSDQ